ncbi:pentatricopeptide repeat-containing protein At2g35030, mitochondrial-like [Selaginella moellendorffii]|uniref:pentatricopeptide repeat-containing protein At2g35030, mitochondrial-like n=1 Tax=Selaginella moellendorffii TaxID=88036 RepID=UPI000D1C3793|nr:pentatricopeptide repeat-containing protein At2g35030, mitochondrial-like [Selaginella moellendorffii]|eukprot:XP_024543605.1 pentatricopeptide repeat-containing protein At2g35030, mitochondrial-like [Selaginella moellendorffii]
MQCSRDRDFGQGKIVHCQIQQTLHRHDRFLSNLLVEMYARCGKIEEAMAVFESISSPNIYSWNMILAAFATNGHPDRAAATFHRMPQRDVVSWNQILQATAPISYGGGYGVFLRMPMHNVISWTTLIVASSHQGHLREAKDLFDRIPSRDPLCWNTLAQGYILVGLITAAIGVLFKMPLHNLFSMNAMVTASAATGDLVGTRKVFEEVIAERNLVTWNTMLAVYSGTLDESNRIFARMPHHDMISWNSIVTAHCRHGLVDRAGDLFHRMPEKSIEAWNSLARSKAENGQLQEAVELLESIDRLDLFASNTMILTYGEAGRLDRAKRAFDHMLQRDVVSWSSMITALAQSGHLDASLSGFDRMPARDVPAWNAMIQNLGQLGCTRKSKFVFDQMPERGLESWTTLISAFAAHGHFHETKLVFDRMPQLAIHSWTLLLGVIARQGDIHDPASIQKIEQHHDVVSATAIVSAYARNGHFSLAMVSLRSMLLLGLSPNEVTFTATLAGLSDAGLVEVARDHFVSMGVDYFVAPNEEHYACLVQLLGKARQIERAEELLYTMPFVPDMVAWTSLLDACRAFGEIERAIRLARAAIEWDPGQSQPYVVLHNAFAEANVEKNFAR